MRLFIYTILVVLAQTFDWKDIKMDFKKHQVSQDAREHFIKNTIERIQHDHVKVPIGEIHLTSYSAHEEGHEKDSMNIFKAQFHVFSSGNQYDCNSKMFEQTAHRFSAQPIVNCQQMEVVQA